MKFFSLFFVAILLALPLSAQSPRIFFSDLESGPNTGGQNNHGVWVTIWGKGFGAERGKSAVTIGGGEAAGYPIWTDTKITFQLGPAARTGEIVVNPGGKNSRAGGAASNGIPFVVRPGKIYFVAVNGSDRHSGSFDAPWRSIIHAKNKLSAGDVAYIRDGVAQTSEDSFTAYVSMDRDGGSNSGKPDAPKALVAYPGA